MASFVLGELPALTNGQLIIGSTGAAPVAASLTAGTNITITPGAGTITIAATGGGTPGGADTQVQFNDSGAFGGDAQFTFNKTSGLITLVAAAHAGAALARFNPDSGASFVQINNNGTMVIDSDVSTGTNPLIIKYNGSTIASIDFGGTWTAASFNAAAGLFTAGSTGVQIVSNTNAGLKLGSSGDLNFSRISSGLGGIGTGAAGSFAGSLKLTTIEHAGNILMTGATSVIRLKGYTVATLPAGTQGDTAFVTDALAPTFLATVVGGGAVVTPVFFNGANWVGY